MTRAKDMTLKQTKHNTIIRNVINKKDIKSKNFMGLKYLKNKIKINT